MKRFLALFLALIMVLSFCACGSQTAPASDEAKVEPEENTYETEGLIGRQNGSSIRFDTFGMTVELPEGANDAPVNENLPETYAELDAILASDYAYIINWTDFEAPGGSASVHMQIMPCDEGTRPVDVMYYFLETYPNEPGALSYEVKNEPIGGRNGFPCFLAVKKNEYGSQDEILIFDLVDGKYRIECTVETFGWQGAENLAEQIFFIDEIQYETDSLLGIFEWNSIRYEDFGLTILLPQEKVSDILDHTVFPSTYSDLEVELNRSDGWFYEFGTEDHTEAGTWSLDVSVARREDAASENDLLHWDRDWYVKEEAPDCEIVTLSIGENDRQKCLLMNGVGEDGAKQNILLLYKAYSNYYLLCRLVTYDWEGAADIAQQIFRPDKPGEMPFVFDDSGLFVIRDYSLFGKTFDEVREVLPQIAPLSGYDYWTPKMDYTTVSVDDFTVTLLFNQNGRLEAVMNEEVGGECYEAAFAKARELSGDVYFYNPMDGNAYFIDGGNYFFLNGEVAPLVLARCDGEENIIITQRYIAQTFTYENLCAIATDILSGRVDNMKKEQGMNIAVYAAEQKGTAAAFRDVAELYEMKLNDNDKALEWYINAAETGDADAMYELGTFYIRSSNDAVSALSWYEKAAELDQPWAKVNFGGLCAQMDSSYEPDYDKAAKYLLEEIDSGDISVASAAKGWLYSLYLNNQNQFSADTGTAADELFMPIEEAAKNGDADAMLAIAKMTEVFDFDSSLTWYENAAENGNGEAAGLMGNVYLNWNDYAKALEWYEKGASLGDDHSTLCYGELLVGAIGNLKKDMNKGTEFILSASKSKNPEVRKEALQCIVDIWYFSLDALTPELQEEVQASAVATVQENRDHFIPDVLERVDALMKK